LFSPQCPKVGVFLARLKPVVLFNNVPVELRASPECGGVLFGRSGILILHRHPVYLAPPPLPFRFHFFQLPPPFFNPPPTPPKTVECVISGLLDKLLYASKVFFSFPRSDVGELVPPRCPLLSFICGPFVSAFPPYSGFPSPCFFGLRGFPQEGFNFRFRAFLSPNHPQG